MKIVIKKCHECGALGVGPHAVKLWPFESRMYCKEHYKDPLQWHENRAAVTQGIESVFTFEQAAALLRRWGRKNPVVRITNWKPHIQELCALAEFGLLRGDKRTFVHYASRAIYAWGLSQEERP